MLILLPFIELTITVLAASPNAFFIAIVSHLSLSGVDVPCALIYVISSGSIFASLMAATIALAPPSPSGAGEVI